MQHIIVDTPGLAISYDYTDQWLYVNWRGEHDQESTRAGCAVMLEALSQWPTAKILNDNTNITRAALRFTAWGVAWLQDMYASGLRYLAWVYAAEFDNRQASEKLVRLMTHPTVASFDTIESAREWLSQQKITL